MAVKYGKEGGGLHSARQGRNRKAQLNTMPVLLQSKSRQDGRALWLVVSNGKFTANSGILYLRPKGHWPICPLVL